MKGNLYVTDTASGVGTISKIVIKTGDITELIATGTFDDPEAITTDGINLYVTAASDGTISKIVIATLDITELAHGYSEPIGITSDGKNLYWVNEGDSTVSKMVIATKNTTPVATLPAGKLYGITTEGTRLFVTDLANGTISEIK